MPEYDDLPAEIRQQLELDDRARVIVARFRADKGFMQRAREGYEEMAARQREAGKRAKTRTKRARA